MAKLHIPVGISGSGKSTLWETLDPPPLIICPDDIRLELTGDISNQSQNKRVFDLAFDRVFKAIGAGKDAFFDATNLQRKSIDTLLSIGKRFDAEIFVYLLEDSKNVELCRARVGKDMKEGVIRSDTSDATKKIQERQSQAYIAIIPYIQSLNFKRDFEIRIIRGPSLPLGS